MVPILQELKVRTKTDDVVRSPTLENWISQIGNNEEMDKDIRNYAQDMFVNLMLLPADLFSLLAFFLKKSGSPTKSRSC